MSAACLAVILGGGPGAVPAQAAPTTTTAITTSPTSTPTTTGPLPAQLLASAISAVGGQRAVDWTQTMVQGADSYTQVTQAGREDGTSSITVHAGKITLTLDWALIGKTVYFKGNINALSGSLGFTTTAATHEAGKWISATAGAGVLFQNLSSYLTVPSATTILDMVGEMTLLPAATVRGQAVLGIQGVRLSEEEKVTETIYVKSTGVPLPVELSQIGQGSTLYTYFGPWGRPPVAKAPQSVLRLSKAWLASS
jgi:hypothetical protein